MGTPINMLFNHHRVEEVAIVVEEEHVRGKRADTSCKTASSTLVS